MGRPTRRRVSLPAFRELKKRRSRTLEFFDRGLVLLRRRSLILALRFSQFRNARLLWQDRRGDRGNVCIFVPVDFVPLHSSSEGGVCL